MKIVLQGVPGVGKSTLLNKIIEKLKLISDQNNDLNHDHDISLSTNLVESSNDVKNININANINNNSNNNSNIMEDESPIFGVYTKEKLDINKNRIGFVTILNNNEKEYNFMTKRNINSNSNTINTNTNTNINSNTTTNINRIGNYDVDINTIESIIIPELNKTFNYASYIVYIDEIGKAQMCSMKFHELLSSIYKHSNNYNKFILATIVEEELEWSLKFKYDEDIWLIHINITNRSEYESIIINMINSRKYMKQCTSKQIQCIKILFEYLCSHSDYIALNKLFKNSIEYVIQHQTSISLQTNRYSNDTGSDNSTVFSGTGMCTGTTTTTTSTTASNDTIEYVIKGFTNTHIVKYHTNTNIYYCDCPLANRQGKYVNIPVTHVPRMQAICSHQLCIRICTNNTEFHSKNLF